MSLSNPLTVLVIDDDPVDQRAITRLLPSNWNLVLASNGESAEKQIYLERPDVVLLDYNIPGTNTLDLLLKLGKEKLPVVILTGQGSEQVAVEAMKKGAKDYIIKGDLASHDIIHRIQLAIDNQNLERELEERQQDLEDFAHMAAHDLNAPLTYISGSCILARELAADKLDGKTLDLLDVAVRGAEQMSLMIHDLLEYSKVGRSARAVATCDLNVVIKRALDNLRTGLIEKNVQFSSDELPSVLGDELSLVQLFQNLFSNAFKYCERTPPSIQVSCKELDKEWEFRIKDNGIGIPQGSLPAIFRPFERAHSDRDYLGSGIGLATCRKIVDQHRGKIWVESTVGEGSTFFFTLPKVS